MAAELLKCDVCGYDPTTPVSSSTAAIALAYPFCSPAQHRQAEAKAREEALLMERLKKAVNEEAKAKEDALLTRVAALEQQLASIPRCVKCQDTQCVPVEKHESHGFGGMGTIVSGSKCKQKISEKWWMDK
jgi:DNA-directed RNA polymerase subunit M/transcription elongation factor TFIIS